MTRDVVPTLVGPLPDTDADHQFNSVRDYDEPLDLAAHGFVEQEYFTSGVAAVYDDGLSVLREVPYTNRLIVRRPLGRPGSGRVYVEILNPSNGYDAEGLWRRAWDWFLANGHTYVAFSVKPVTIDACKNYDPARYASLSWDLDPDNPHEPVGPDFPPLEVVPGCEEGIAWDVITQTGNLLRSPVGLPVLGGSFAEPLVLVGQSQSAHYLNTWLRHFHPHTDGLWDAFVISVGSTIERPLRQEPVAANGFYATLPNEESVPVDVPTISITCEGDVNLYRGLEFTATAKPGLGQGPNRRSWCVVGPGHTEVTSRVMPGNPGVVRAGRQPRVMTAEALASANTFPLQPAVTGALDALVPWLGGGEPPASVSFEVDDAGELLRDADGNALGGLRFGLIEYPVATFTGSPTGGTLGTMEFFSVERVLSSFPTRESYLRAVASVDDALLESGYLNDVGFSQLQEIAGELWDLATSR